jgi:pyruvate formate lyase activating enzyme
MKQIGKSYTVDEVMAEVLRDRGIYEKHGGGLTYTGGEPFAQPDFLLALLERTKAEGIRAAVETCAYTDWDYIETALEFLDFVLIDIKLLDEQEHIRHTGVSNTSILENCKKLSSSCAQRGIPLVVRTPVIPGVNDTVDATSAIAGFIHAYMPQTKYYQLLPYHRLGRGKYENLGRVYALNELEPPSEAYIQELNNIIHDYGLQTSYE